MDETPDFLMRVSRHPEPGMWIGALRRAFGPVAELYEGPPGEAADALLDSHPPHYLLALWKPLQPRQVFLPRWPAKVGLVAPDAAAAVRDMLVELPPTARLWLAEHPVDWALMAEIVMLGEPGLQPYHYRELQGFIEAERQNTRAAISVHYAGRDEVFEHFVRTTPGALDAPDAPG